MSQSSQKGYIRKQYLVDKEMQTYHLKVWVLSSVVIIATIACFFYFFKVRPDAAKDPVITENLYVVLIGTAAFIILYSILMGLQAMLHSHRVAGAEYNLKNSIRKFTQRDFGHRVVLRKGDYLQGLAESLNEMAARHQEDRENFMTLMDKLEKLQGLPEDAKEILTSMEEALQGPQLAKEEDKEEDKVEVKEEKTEEKKEEKKED